MRDEKEARRITAGRMPGVLAALADLGWKDTGEHRHPIGYPGNHRVVRGDEQMDVWPAVEDYRVVGIARHLSPTEYEMICSVNGATLRVVESVETKLNFWDFVDTDKDLADVLEPA